MAAQTTRTFLEGKGDIFNGLTITELPDTVEEFERILNGKKRIVFICYKFIFNIAHFTKTLLILRQ